MIDMHFKTSSKFCNMRVFLQLQYIIPFLMSVSKWLTVRVNYAVCAERSTPYLKNRVFVKVQDLCVSTGSLRKNAGAAVET